MVTYANDGDVLDVVGGRHAVGGLLVKMRCWSKVSLMLYVCSGMIAKSRRWLEGQYLCVVEVTMERTYACLTPTSYSKCATVRVNRKKIWMFDEDSKRAMAVGQAVVTLPISDVTV